MPEYLYACDDPEHERWQVRHSMIKKVHVICPKCHRYMYRVPQPFRFYMNPQNLLLDKMSDRFAEYQKEKKYGIKRKHARGEPI